MSFWGILQLKCYDAALSRVVGFLVV